MQTETACSNTRPFPISKDLLDTTNSVSWFLMDAFWMLEMTGVARTLILPTLATGLLLLYIEKRRTVFWINLTINCWILMNVFWMMDRISSARISFALGILMIGIAIIDGMLQGKSARETFSHFRRFRVLNLK